MGALISATKSVSVKSVSCPTADITGVEALNTASTTSGSLKAHKSSIEPPPRPTIIQSRPILSSLVIPLTIDCFACSP